MSLLADIKRHEGYRKSVYKDHLGNDTIGYGFLVRARQRHPSHRDRLNALNRKLKNADAEKTMFVSPNCVELIKDLEQCTRDIKTGGISKTDIERTHFLDACSYPIEYKFSVTQNRAYSVKW